MDPTPDAYAEHVKQVRERVAKEEAARAARPVTCHAELDYDVVELLHALVGEHIGKYSLRVQTALQRADMQLLRALDG